MSSAAAAVLGEAKKDPDVASRVGDVSCLTSTKHRMNDGWSSRKIEASSRSSRFTSRRSIMSQSKVHTRFIVIPAEKSRTCRIDDDDDDATTLLVYIYINFVPDGHCSFFWLALFGPIQANQTSRRPSIEPVEICRLDERPNQPNGSK